MTIKIDLGHTIVDLDYSIERCREFLEWYLSFLKVSQPNAHNAIRCIEEALGCLPGEDDVEFEDEVKKAGFSYEEDV